jgi:hypothetical protein
MCKLAALDNSTARVPMPSTLSGKGAWKNCLVYRLAWEMMIQRKELTSSSHLVPALPLDKLRKCVDYPGGQEPESDRDVNKVLGDLDLGGCHRIDIATLGAKRFITFRGIPLLYADFHSSAQIGSTLQ